MSSHVDHSFFDSSQAGNLTSTERWLSVAAGALLTLAAARRGGILRKLILGSAGASLISRGASGYCAMKAAVAGQTPLRAGLQEQWSRTRRGFDRLGDSGVGSWARRAVGGSSQAIDNLHVLYVIELQELYSAEQQMADLVERISQRTAHANLAARFSKYATELRARAVEIDKVLTGIGAVTRSHPDQAMRALLNEAHKVSRITASNVRDAALLASLQRIIHYKIAGYGTIAAYAKSLGRTEEATRFSTYSTLDKQMDADLSEFAQDTLNPDANRSPTAATAEIRTH